MKEYYFHVNPPEQRGKKRDKKSRATFAGFVPLDPKTELPSNTMQIGVSFCHSVDQFSRAVGRVKAKGNAMSKQHRPYDVTNVDPKNLNDFFVQQCRAICEENGMQHDYKRRTKNKKKLIGAFGEMPEVLVTGM